MKNTAQPWISILIIGISFAPLLGWGQAPRFERVIEYGSPYYVGQTAMVLDSADNLYVAGNFTGQLCLQDTCLYAPAFDAESGYIISFDPLGAIRWMRLIGQGEGIQISGMEAGAQGIHLVGNFYDVSGSLIVGDSTWTVSSRGVLGATVSFQGVLRGDYVIEQARVDRMTIDSEGKLLIAGFFRRDTTHLLDSLLIKERSIESFWARINPNGFVEQTQVFQCPVTSLIERIESNAAGEVFLSGLMEEWIVIDGDTLWSMTNNPSKRDVFLVKLSPQKELVWSRVGTPISEMILDTQGRLIVTGEMKDTIRWGSQTILPGYYLTRLEETGDPEWVFRNPIQPNLFLVTGMATRMDHIYTYCRYNARLELPDTTYVGIQQDNFIFCHTTEDGRLLWHKKIGVDDVYESPSDILLTSQAEIIVAGYFHTDFQNYTYLDTIQVTDRYPIDGFGPWHYIGITGPDTLFSTSVYSETESRLLWNAYPNPTRHTLYIEGDQAGQPVKLSLMDLQGRAWQQEFLIWSEDSYPIDVSHLPDGIYFLHIQTNTGQTIFRLIKQR